MTKMDYIEKLKDPRWQKLRLEVFERDNWTCQSCHDNESTLHIHHHFYEWGKDPWEYKIEDLVTMCDECHEIEKEDSKQINLELIKYMRKVFINSSNLDFIIIGLKHMVFYKTPYIPELLSSAIEELLMNHKDIKELQNKYLSNLKKTNAKNKISKA